VLVVSEFKTLLLVLKFITQVAVVALAIMTEQAVKAVVEQVVALHKQIKVAVAVENTAILKQDMAVALVLSLLRLRNKTLKG
jgi:hypothetical protein